MTTTYIITFYSIIGALIITSFIAGYILGKHKNAPNVSPNKKVKMRKVLINTNIPRIHTESQRDHVWDERAPP